MYRIKLTKVSHGYSSPSVVNHIYLQIEKEIASNEIKVVLTRRKAIARPLSESFRKVNPIILIKHDGDKSETNIL